MSIDDVMERTIEYGLMMRTATISESRALNTSIRAAIEQHVAEAVTRETERCADAAREWEDNYVIEDSAPRHVDDAIRTHADNEVTK